MSMGLKCLNRSNNPVLVLQRLIYIAAAAILLFGFILLYPPFRSYLVMYAYSWMHHRQSVLHEDNISFSIPGGLSTQEKDWYPFVIVFTYNEGFSRYIGEEAYFSVLYNFGRFDLKECRSVYYNLESPYYSSFYGGYIVKLKTGRPFGFMDDGRVDTEELAKVARFDQIYLVLPSLGCPFSKRVFEENILSVDYNITYLGYRDWVRIDSEIITNSPLHGYRKWQRGYFQFGSPPSTCQVEDDFPLVNLKGRAYVRYFEELSATIVLYVMAPHWNTVDTCDRDILQKTNIEAGEAGAGEAGGRGCCFMENCVIKMLWGDHNAKSCPEEE